MVFLFEHIIFLTMSNFFSSDKIKLSCSNMTLNCAMSTLYSISQEKVNHIKINNQMIIFCGSLLYTVRVGFLHEM
jgi:hypothetical protein